MCVIYIYKYNILWHIYMCKSYASYYSLKKMSYRKLLCFASFNFNTSSRAMAKSQPSDRHTKSWPRKPIALYAPAVLAAVEFSCVTLDGILVEMIAGFCWEKSKPRTHSALNSFAAIAPRGLSLLQQVVENFHKELSGQWQRLRLFQMFKHLLQKLR